jgi:hypothetical protein
MDELSALDELAELEEAGLDDLTGMSEIAGGPGLLRSSIEPATPEDVPAPDPRPIGAPAGDLDDAALDREPIE